MPPVVRNATRRAYQARSCQKELDTLLLAGPQTAKRFLCRNALAAIHLREPPFNRSHQRTALLGIHRAYGQISRLVDDVTSIF